MISANKGMRFLILAVIIVVALLGIVAFPWFWRRTLSDRLIRAELYMLMSALEHYSHNNGFIYPVDLSVLDDELFTFLETPKVNDLRRRLKVSSLVDHSSVEYVWIGPKRYAPDHVLKTPEQVDAQFDALEKLYGEFEYYRSTYGTDIRQGMPGSELIVLLYDTDPSGERTYVVFLDHSREILLRKEADAMVVLQNAYLRLPVNRSDAEILSKGLTHPNSGFRFRSAEALAKLGMPEGKEFLKTAFKSDDEYQIIRSADALARLGDIEAIEFLQRIYNESDDRYFRYFAERTLREINRWQDDKRQYYTDDEWEQAKQWGSTPLPIF